MASNGDRHADAVTQDRDWQAVRKEIGLTKPGLASKLSVNSQTIGRWERGQTEPAIAYQRQMLQLLDEDGPEACGCVGCTDDADLKILHPEKGERTVCETHAHGYEVLEVLHV